MSPRVTGPLSSAQRKELETSIGYRFKKAAHLVVALTHRSYIHELKQKGSKEVLEPNERLEFLGDAVLDLVITVALLKQFPEKSEGELSKLRAALVQEKTLAKVAQELGLDKQILMGEAEARAGGRKKPSILADAYEALLGAIYIDAGTAKVEKVILKHFEKLLNTQSLSRRVVDYKTKLQEITQARWKKAPHYRTLTATGPDHQKVFDVECHLDGRVLGTGRANSKKEAGQQAARAAIQMLRKEEAPAK